MLQARRVGCNVVDAHCYPAWDGAATPVVVCRLGVSATFFNAPKYLEKPWRASDNANLLISVRSSVNKQNFALKYFERNTESKPVQLSLDYTSDFATNEISSRS